MIKPGSLPAPGLVWGGYPQREVAPATWGEHVLAGLSATATALAGRAAGRRARFVERVRQCAQWAGSLSADSARADLRALRTQLGRYGLEEALVAECFGWTIQAVQARMGVRLHDTQIIAGWIMSRGRLAEMATGEGKTLAAALPAIACAMAGSPVHVITANDYLVRRDAELLRPVYGDLGLSVGVVTADMEPDARRVAYGADVVYCTAKELVFDYLRDRLAGLPPSDLHRHARALVPARGAAPRPLLRGLCMAVIDEADSILIDEARTPLIISRPVPGAEPPAVWRRALELARRLKPAVHYRLDFTARLAELNREGEDALREWTEAGDGRPEAESGRAEPGAGPSQAGGRPLGGQRSVGAHPPGAGPSQAGGRPLGGQRSVGAHPPGADGSEPGDDPAQLGRGVLREPRRRAELVGLALQALHLLERDRHYIVRDGKVLVVDPHTGRVAEGRQWSRGLQQLLEVKEDCAPSDETETAARITYQRFFPRYHRLCGMSGTLAEARGELRAIYGLDVEPVPLRLPGRRRMLPTRVFAAAAEIAGKPAPTSGARWQAVLERIAQMQEQGRPVLVGTDSVADSEALGRRLEQLGIAHTVLNARQDADEAEVIAGAGKARAVTVATNMAGRGTDIHLGPGVAEAGGLHVICCQHNGSRRIDRQLVGRCARQGDPGSAETLLSLDEGLMARHLPASLRGWLALRGAARPLPPWLGRRLARAAQRMEEARQRYERWQLARQDADIEARLSFTGRGE